jgi:holin-like protein
MLESLFVLLIFQLLGTTLGLAFQVPIPGPVMGLVLLAGWTLARLPLPGELPATASTLLRHLSLLFVPAATGIIQHLERLVAEGWILILALVVSTTLALVVGTLTFLWVVRWTGTLPEPEELRRD